MSARLLLTLLAIAAALAGCQTVSVDPRALPGNIGVISIAGQYLTQKNVGFTVFGNEFAAFDVAAWSLDREYAQKLQGALERKAGVKASVLDVKVEALKPIYDVTARPPVWADLDPSWSKSEGALREIASAQGVDTLVILAPDWSDDYFTRSNQRLYGLGIYTRSLADLTRAANLHFLATVVLVSGKTGKPFASLAVSNSYPEILGSQRGRPSRELTATLARTPFDKMTPAQRSEIEAKARDLDVDGAIETTVTQLFSRR
jgi:hypothetical protein